MSKITEALKNIKDCQITLIGGGGGLPCKIMTAYHMYAWLLLQHSPLPPQLHNQQQRNMRKYDS